jgi:predicted metal-binding membrane protein
VTAPAASFARPALRLTPQNLALWGVAALAWAGVVAYARDMGNGAGTMGMPFAEFLPMWSLMMTAMMLPAVAPVAALYLRTIDANRPHRLLLFVAGYLVVWVTVGIAAFLALRFVDDHVADDGATMRTLAAVLLAAAGVYQLTPFKAVCLRHCRSPLGQLLRYGNVKGRARDLYVALHHAAFCLGCCWALMALFVAFGVMNLWAMLGLALVVVSEKLSRHGEAIGRAAGAAGILLALLVVVSPRVADAVVPALPSGPQPMTEM